MFIPTDHACMVVARFMQPPEEFSFTTWFTKPNYSLSDLQGIADAVGAQVAGTILPELSIYIDYLGSRAYDMRTENGPVATSYTGAGDGGKAGQVLVPSISCVLTLRTANRGRSGRGRLFIAGWSEDNLEMGGFTSAAVGAVEDFGSGLLSAAALIGWTWCVVSRYTNGQPRAKGLAQPVVNSEVRSTKPGTQRRRIDRP